MPQNVRIITESEINEQRRYCALLKDILPVRFGHEPVAFVHSYGCQQNVSDAERMKGQLEEMGFTFTDDIDKADMVLFNTCAVREHAEDRVFGNIGALKKKKRSNPSCVLAVCGCMTQQQSVADKIRKSYPYVDLLFGTHENHRLPEMLFDVVNSQRRVFVHSDTDGVIAEGVPVHRDSGIKGWLPIMYGCNNFCTYCIVPYVKGRERSRKPDDVINEAKQMVAQGIKDITLLGQNVNSYGNDTDYGVNFAQLLRKINAIDGDFRIRFMTSHPKDCTRELLEAMRDCEKVCRHLHLPFQSGNDRVLQRMNRRYTREHYLSLVDMARELMPDISLTSDVIVGFPGETYEEFCDTLSLIEQVRYTSLFTFIYSPREGTKAAQYDDPYTHAEKAKRMGELLKIQENISSQIMASYVGKTYRLLCEERRESGELFGRLSSNMGVVFDGDDSLIGNFVDVEITQAMNFILKGKCKTEA